MKYFIVALIALAVPANAADSIGHIWALHPTVEKGSLAVSATHLLTFTTENECQLVGKQLVKNSQLVGATGVSFKCVKALLVPTS